MADLPYLIDTHAHICDPAFKDDRDDVLARAIAAGIRVIIAVGEDAADAEENLELAERYPVLHPAADLYPTILDPAAAGAMVDFIRRHRGRLWAIGEVGLDFWVVKEEKERALQREIFIRFIRLARELDLPLNVHSRSAGRHAVQMLLEYRAERVQMHAFDGKISAARPALEAGFCFSVPPSIVRSRQKQKLVRHLPLEKLLVETDSPVLGAEPGERNEPAYLMTAVRAISEIKEIHEEAVLEAVTKNARELYRIRL
ncbi:Putative deoxyribonuclease YcfH [Olavius algarvensis associated proteobacterium Delta 3]|nr:Putative deoxyribonuclease YcfH [Olavius algarvensis associated proteobacterium Delta 3]